MRVESAVSDQQRYDALVIGHLGGVVNRVTVVSGQIGAAVDQVLNNVEAPAQAGVEDGAPAVLVVLVDGPRAFLDDLLQCVEVAVARGFMNRTGRDRFPPCALEANPRRSPASQRNALPNMMQDRARIAVEQGECALCGGHPSGPEAGS